MRFGLSAAAADKKDDIITFVCFFVTGSARRLCHHRHGSVLVHRVHAAGRHRAAARRPLPHDGHHDGWRGEVTTQPTLILCFFIGS